MGELIDFRDKWLGADSGALLLAGLYVLEIEERGLRLTLPDYLADLRQRRYPNRLIRKAISLLTERGLILPGDLQEVRRDF